MLTLLVALSVVTPVFADDGGPTTEQVKDLRVSREVELEGLDMPEMGTLGYPVDWEPSPEALVNEGIILPKGALGSPAD